MPPLDPTMQPPPQGMPPGNPQEEEAVPGEETAPSEEPEAAGASELSEQPEQASPEEQAMADRFVLRAWKFMYGDKMFPKIVEMLRSDDPVEGLAKATVLVVTRVADAARDAGQEIDPVVLYHAGTDVFEELADVSRQAQIKDFSEDPDGLEKAWLTALDLFRTQMESTGRIDKASAQAGFEDLQRADQDGRLERTMMGLVEHDGQAPGGQAGGPDQAPAPPPQPQRKGLATAMGG